MAIDEEQQKLIDRGDFLEDDEDEELEEESEDEIEDKDNGEEETPDSDVDDEDDGEGEEEEEIDQDEGGEAEEEGDDSESEEDEEETDNERDQRVPLSRLNQVIEQRNKEADRVEWLEEQLEKLIEQGQLPTKEEDVKDPFDFISAEARYIDLILEGSTDDAIKLRSDIDKERVELLKSEISKVRDEAIQNSRGVLEDDKFDLAVDSYKNKYEFLDDENDGYNEEAVDTTNALMSSFMAKGDSKTTALKKAVERVAPMYGKPKPEKLGNKTSKKATATRKKNVDVMKKTPPTTRNKKGSSRDLETVDVFKMGEKAFKGLSAKEKAILRGDIV